MDISPHLTALLLLAVSLAGALPPLFRRWSDRGLHVFVAVAAGIFLGTIFLHLLPELAGAAPASHEGAPGEGGHVASLGPWIAALFGLLLLFALERVWLRSYVERAGPNVHTGLWVATYLGLSLHSLTAGVALTAILHSEGVRMQFLISYLAHKASETFSLATVMRLADVRVGPSLLLLGCFAAIEPLALLFGSELFAHHPETDALLTGFACGTFLYVAVCDLLPEVFHGGDHPWLKLGAVALGVLATAFTPERAQDALQFAGGVAAQFWSILVDMAPFLLGGFLLAGILHQFLGTGRLARWLRGDDFASVGRAALIGAPLPLCSCSVVPVAIEMHKQGASKGATTAFLISTPETGVDSVSVSWALLDPLLTIARPIGAVLSALFAGSLVNVLVRRGWDKAPEVAALRESAHACCEHDVAAPATEALDHAGHAHVASAPSASRLQRVLGYAYVEMLDDLAPSLVIGLFASAVIGVLLPHELFESGLGHGFPGMLLMLCLGIPLYVCASASTPIAAMLIHKGLSPGAAFVFLLAGPATNLGSLIVLARQLGVRVILVMLLGLSVCALGLGLAVDWAYALLAIEPTARMGEHAHALPEAFSSGCALVLAGLLALSFARTALRRLTGRRARLTPELS